MNVQLIGHTCPHCGAKAKAAPRAKASTFNPWATKSENLREHGTLPPWQAKRRKRAKLERKVVVRVVFADGVTCNTSTYFAKPDGSPDVDAIVRAEREVRMMRAAWAAVGGLPQERGTREQRPRTHDLSDAEGRTYHGLYLERIPKVTSVTVEPFANFAITAG